MSDTTTRGVRVQVDVRYVPEQSEPGKSWFFAYTVTVENVGDRPVRLWSRHWIITDATGRQQNVKGLGVVGQQPRLMPGERHTYTSACPMPTSMGTMHGTYQMVTDEGDRFDAEIAPFTLADPLTLN
ncbi:MAG: Co2+/Mg2+ efflux protein ApaG [Deltaproteobacteria bacterium]|jgi:ApaG protein|nr:Co2+/Mg2+ efflux protein ApaG [Deltaproteobacteria bacterium]MBK9371824.1 Co2+/Mg2+ efflux protein ApaG [Deltaproteobacteria bacterium]MBK9644048.1 Co2+/Mg2+ efflux protein ApaG [Deltaproteobacteria bacterium]MCK6515232.1 Co2+/Mg2+ efflux protein ApaG [Myxococcota bacterium]